MRGHVKGAIVKINRTKSKEHKRKVPPYGWCETVNTKMMNFRLPRTTIDKLEMFSADHFVTKTSVVVQALEEYLQ